MDAKKIAAAGLSAGAMLFVLLFGLNIIMNSVIPYDIAQFPGMRPMDDPVMMLFFIYPFVLAFAAAAVFDIVQPALTGTLVKKGLSFGAIMIVLVAIPSNFAMYTSLDWPVTFTLGNMIWSVTGFSLAGVIFARIWERS